MTAEPKQPDNPWEGVPVISRYTRAQAIEDGVLVDLMQHPTPERPELDDLRTLVREVGFQVPVTMTATAFVQVASPIDGKLPPGQSLKDRLRDVLWTLKAAIYAMQDGDRVHFTVAVWNGLIDNGWKKFEAVALWALYGPGDEGEPVLTIMLEGED